MDEGDILCLLGPSGCGKTTLLRIVAGLETPDSGKVLFEGRDIRDVPVHQRNFGLMFQDQALFLHKNVFENMAFGLRMQRLPEEEIRERVAEVLDLVGRSFRGDHYRLLVRHADGLEMAFVVETMATDLPQPGEGIRLRLRREAVTLLPPDLY